MPSSTHEEYGYRIDVCRGLAAGRCPHVLGAPAGLADRARAVAEASGWSRTLSGLLRPPRHHELFSISLAGCPNGCSRPHIADFGLIAAARPEFDNSLCTGCTKCVRACREGALRLRAGTIEIDRSRCLDCGACARACPAGALCLPETLFRVVVGGRLGRRPKLAEELPVRLSETGALAALDRAMEIAAVLYRPGVRFADLVAETELGARSVLS